MKGGASIFLNDRSFRPVIADNASGNSENEPLLTDGADLVFCPHFRSPILLRSVFLLLHPHYQGADEQDKRKLHLR